MDEAQTYKIADFPVVMNCRSADMLRLTAPYLARSAEAPAIDLRLTEERRSRPGMSPAMAEYNHTLFQFVCQLIEKDAFCFHAAALSVDGEGILFSADSGTGKSTHARLWQEYMTGHQFLNLNDDKPVIRLLEGKPWVYGSPWSGKHSINHNGRAPVKALVFLERGEENRIQPLPPEQVFPLVFPQVICSKRSQQQLALLMDLLDQFIRGIAVYRLQCNISEEAVRLVYETVWNR